jgi:predicted protein tyrosine phosphatase
MIEKEMQIEVLSRQEVEKFKTDLPHIVISVKDPGTEQANLLDNPNCMAVLYLEFSDIEVQRESLEVLKLFSQDDAKAILSLIKLMEPYINLIVVNCEAGISRSAAIGAALSILLKLPDKDSRFFTSKGRFYPNRFIYRTILNQAIEEGWK